MTPPMSSVALAQRGPRQADGASGPRRLSGAAAGLALLLALTGSGCALTSKAEALSPRYFSPAPSALERTAQGGRAPSLRLGRVEPAGHLETRMAYRPSETELAYHEDRRWTEPPERFVRRTLERALFESGAFERRVSGPGPILDVEVASFEELRAPPPRARLALVLVLRDDRRALLDRSLRIEVPLERPADGAGGPLDAGAALAAAMGHALDRAARQVTEQVRAELAQEAVARHPE